MIKPCTHHFYWFSAYWHQYWEIPTGNQPPPPLGLLIFFLCGGGGGEGVGYLYFQPADNAKKVNTQGLFAYHILLQYGARFPAELLITFVLVVHVRVLFCSLVSSINQFLIILGRCTLYTPKYLQDRTCIGIFNLHGV